MVPNHEVIRVGGDLLDMVVSSIHVVKRGTPGQPMDVWASLDGIEKSMQRPARDTNFDPARVAMEVPSTSSSDDLDYGQSLRRSNVGL